MGRPIFHHRCAYQQNNHDYELVQLFLVGIRIILVMIMVMPLMILPNSKMNSSMQSIHICMAINELEAILLDLVKILSIQQEHSRRQHKHVKQPVRIAND